MLSPIIYCYHHVKGTSNVILPKNEPHSNVNSLRLLPLMESQCLGNLMALFLATIVTFLEYASWRFNFQSRLNANVSLVFMSRHVLIPQLVGFVLILVVAAYLNNLMLDSWYCSFLVINLLYVIFQIIIKSLIWCETNIFWQLVVELFMMLPMKN